MIVKVGLIIFNPRNEKDISIVRFAEDPLQFGYKTTHLGLVEEVII